jgi:hypothetical protein
MPGTFPTLTANPDSSKFGYEKEDPAIKLEMEGGYMISRARHTRALRRTFTLVYTYISDADKVLLDAFWDTMKGGSDYFTWTNPENSTAYTVRFKTPMKIEYRGRYNLKKWDVSVTIEEV